MDQAFAQYCKTVSVRVAAHMFRMEESEDLVSLTLCLC